MHAHYAQTHSGAIFAFNEENKDSPDQIITAAKQLQAIMEGLSIRLESGALGLLIGLACRECKR